MTNQISEIAPHVASAASRGSQAYSANPFAAGAGVDPTNPATLQALTEGVSFSPEANTFMNGATGAQDKEKAEKVKEIEKKKEDALEQIDLKVMQLLSSLKTRQDYQQKYKPILIEDFQKAKEDSQKMRVSEVQTPQSPVAAKDPVAQSKKESGFNDPSFLVLNIMAKDERLPKEVQSGFGDISREYAQILTNAQNELSALDRGQSNKAITDNFAGLLPASKAA